jgi:uncharacterized membrane protein HdeD (DUF308 family)
VNGLSTIYEAIRQRGQPDTNWILTLVSGLPAVAIGLLTFFWPQMTGLILLYLIAIHAIIIGAIYIYGAVKIRGQVDFWYLPLAGGIVAVLFGIIAFVLPGATALALVWLIAFYAIAFGGILVGQAFMVRRWRTSFTA